MDRLFRAIARLVTVLTISFGVRPPIVAVLELLQRPSVRIVMIARRRLPTDAALFMVDAETQQGDRDTIYQSASEARMVEGPTTANHRARTRVYIPVRTA